MLSTRYSFIYLHVPKTGGNSIQHVLLPLSDDRATRTSGQDGRERFGIVGPVTPRKHARLREYEAAQPGIAAQHRIVISVRHPFERAISGYFSPHRWIGSQQGPHWDEAAFLALLDKTEFRPASDFLRLDSGLAHPEAVLRFESLPDDLARAVDALGLPADTARALPHVNRSAGDTALRRRLLGSRDLSTAVEALYAEDMGAFGYHPYH